ncbi:MAG: glycoside hydrolase family 15 protein [Parvibaculaceae bacterium]
MKQLDLGVIGNCAVASLINAQARHVWFCFPRLDGDPLFNALVNGDDPQDGFMDIVLRGQKTTRQAYLRNTAVLETILEGESGAVRVLDWAPRYKQHGGLFRPPVIMRRIEPLEGRCHVKVRARPVFDYGATRPNITVGSNYLRYSGSTASIRLTTDMPVAYLRDEAFFLLDRPIHLIIGSDEHLPSRVDRIVRDYLDETTAYWNDWVRDLAVPFDWQEPVIRSAITLKLCSFEDTGAILAALTTSIPEAAGSGRNWDYRYCWPRDAYFTVMSLNRLGATTTMENFINYLINSVISSNVQFLAPLYPIVPGTPLEEYEAAALKGFRGMGPVRVGNGASNQRQNDIYGSVILAAAQMFWDMRLPRPGDRALYHQLKPIGMMAKTTSLEADAGIWEYRGRTRAHTFSAVMCWAALERLGRIAHKVGETGDSEEWFTAAVELKERILEGAWNKDGGYFSGSLGGSELDAALLLMPEIGIIGYDDPRFQKTLAAIEKHLLVDGLMMRYAEADDFGMPETAFLVCTFWYIEALANCGRLDEAMKLFERVLGLRNHVGILSEDAVPATGELWGNFPQTYSMVGIIHCARKLSRTWEEGLWRVS